MSLLSRLFGSKKTDGASGPTSPGESYAGFTIYAEPMRDGSRWRIGARVEKEIDGEMRSHRMIRADTFDSHDAAASASLSKAQMLVDQQGDAIFD